MYELVNSRHFFADDVVLFASSNHNLQDRLGQFAGKNEATGLKVSTPMSEAKILCWNVTDFPLWVGGKLLHQVQYLRALFLIEGKVEQADPLVGSYIPPDLETPWDPPGGAVVRGCHHRNPDSDQGRRTDALTDGLVETMYRTCFESTNPSSADHIIHPPLENHFRNIPLSTHFCGFELVHVRGTLVA